MSTDYLTALIQTYGRKPIIIDANLLLLLFIGLYDIEWISKFKRTKQFEKEDFELLIHFLKRFQGILTTPNILTEVSNLAGQLPEEIRIEFHKTFENRFEVLEENYCESKAMAAQPYFSRYGLTDTVIIQLAKGNCLVLTMDLPLSVYLEQQRCRRYPKLT